MDDLISTTDAAKLAEVTPQTIWQWIRDGKIPESIVIIERHGPFRQVHRIKKRAFEEWLQKISH